MTGTDEIRLETRGAVGVITLDRPKALNSLTHAMCVAIDRALRDWAPNDKIAAVVVRSSSERAFCAGGDMRAIHDFGLAHRRGENDGRLLREFFVDEYRMNRRIKTFPKPYIALIDGITMGGGIGVSVLGSHRVATERTVAAMPETRIGLFPDVGTSYLLPRMPGRIGLYIALSGARIEGADLVTLGLATHHVPSGGIAALLDDLAAADWSKGADAILAAHATAPGHGELMQHRGTIDRCFAADRMEAILDALDGDGSDFAKEAAATIRTMSPTSLKITLEELRRGAALDFDACLKMEYRLTQSVLAAHDFYEGVRAQLVDKDRNPKWDPPTLADVDDSLVGDYFKTPADGDLTFPD